MSKKITLSVKEELKRYDEVKTCVSRRSFAFFVCKLICLAKKHTYKKTISCLKEHYSDVCCQGDYVINEMIDIIGKREFTNLLQYIGQDSFKANIFTCLAKTVKHWSDKGIKVNPFWAS